MANSWHLFILPGKDRKTMKANSLQTHPVHLGPGASAQIEPGYSAEMAWYEAYGARHAADGAEGRLVSLFTYSEPWGMWEMHPNGDEVVFCVSGAMTLHQEAPDGSSASVALRPGDYAINLRGVWHTADTDCETTALFITPGEGTEHRPR
jgi:mannose-6-phosphate isomerase-like protein (cupin superfamily)